MTSDNGRFGSLSEPVPSDSGLPLHARRGRPVLSDDLNCNSSGPQNSGNIEETPEGWRWCSAGLALAPSSAVTNAKSTASLWRMRRIPSSASSSVTPSSTPSSPLNRCVSRSASPSEAKTDRPPSAPASLRPRFSQSSQPSLQAAKPLIPWSSKAPQPRFSSSRVRHSLWSDGRLGVTSEASDAHRGDGDAPCNSERPSLMEKIRASYRSASNQAEGSRHSSALSRAAFFGYTKSALEQNSAPLAPHHLELLYEDVRRTYTEMSLGVGGQCLQGVRLSEQEWVHYMLLRLSVPNHPAALSLTRRMREFLEYDPTALSRILLAFEKADADRNGRLRECTWTKAVAEAMPRSATSVSAEYKGSVDGPLLEEGPAFMDYHDFVSLALGSSVVPVELALYDLSQGFARWVPPTLLGGHRFEGIWHSGVRVFGQEFWYGGVILESSFDECPFGKPNRVQRLGTTLRTKNDLLEFLRSDLFVDYNPRTYDVLKRNCNHFSNEVATFLLQKQIPDEVLLQPDWAKNARLVQTLRPFINRWLGGFGDNDTKGAGESQEPEASPCTPHVSSRIDDLTEEWRSRLLPGDIILYRPRFADRPLIVRILQRVRRSADITLLEPVDKRYIWTSVREDPFIDLCRWEVVVRNQVPLNEFYPLVESGARILKAGVTFTDARISEMLRRPRETTSRPCCTLGHRLAVEAHGSGWFRSAPTCNVCNCSSWIAGPQCAKFPAFSASCADRGRNLEQRWHCRKCTDFVVCGPCLRRGLELPDGGVFADMLSRNLAEALLDDSGWLRFRAQSYFNKADHNWTGALDRVKARRVGTRLAAELGLGAHCSITELDLMEILKQRRKREGNSDLMPFEIDEDTFTDCFRWTLITALEQLDRAKKANE